MPPRFISCPLCGRGFGSASIDIHIPQCYDKAIKRWRLNPTGPAPVLPQVQTRGAGKTRASASGFGDEMPISLSTGRAGGSSGSGAFPSEYAQPSENPNLHPCRKCGRTFNFDRIAKHESVCKGDQKRRKFDSRNQRLASLVEEDSVGFGRPSASIGKRGSRGRGGAALSMNAGGGSNTYSSPRGKNTNWRQQHEEFISAIRAARRDQQLDSKGMGMWSAKPPQQQQQRSAPGAASSRFNGGNATTGTASGKMDQSSARFGRIPPQVRTQQRLQGQQRLSHAQAGGIGGPRSAAPANAFGGARNSDNFPEAQTQVKPGFGSRLPRFTGKDVGGGGKIVNSNATSSGMLQAFGRA